MKRVLITVLVVLAAACGPKLPPNTSPEAKIAIRGTQVITALRATLPAIKANTCLPTDAAGRICVKPEDAIKVVTQIEKAAGIAQDLGVVLNEIDRATLVDEKVTKTARARQLLASIQTLITESVSLPVNAEGRQAIVGILNAVTAVLFSVI